MQKKTFFKIVNFFMAAVLALNQAVFLLVPGKIIQAQTTETNQNLTTEIKEPVSSTDDSTAATDSSGTAETTNSILAMDFVYPLSIVSGNAVFSAQTSEEAGVVFYIYQDGRKLKEYASIYQGNKTYYFNWDTTTVANGNYTIKASAKKSGYIDSYKQIEITVENILNTNEPTNITSDFSDDTTINAPNNTEKALDIILVEALQPPLSGNKYISISLNQPVDQAYFTVEGNGLFKKYQAAKDSDTLYHFTWFTEEFPNGYYQVTAIAHLGNDKYTKSFSSEIINETSVNITETMFSTDKSTTTMDQVDIIFNEDFSSSFGGEKKIFISLSQAVDYVFFTVHGNGIFKEYRGIKDNNNLYHFIWYTAEFVNGSYELEAVANKGSRKYYQSIKAEISNISTSPEVLSKEIVAEPFFKEPTSGVLPECEKFGIYSIDNCKSFMLLPPDCRYKGIKTQEECNKFMSMPPDCYAKGISGEECRIFMEISPECREQGILDAEQCKNYLYQHSMPAECREAGARTHEECKRIIISLSMPSECSEAGATTEEECNQIMSTRNYITFECKQASITDPKECDSYMTRNFMSPECREAGVASQEECDYMLREKLGNLDNLTNFETHSVKKSVYFNGDKGMPQECLEAGIITPEECDNIMFAKHMPIECKEAGANSKEECDKAMFMHHMPYECRETGITDPEECDKHLRAIHLPPECREAGITNEEECEKLLFKKHAPAECIEAGITNEEECEKLMFKKFAPDDCREAGIFSPEACKKYMFEKYGGAENIPPDKLPLDCKKAGAKTADECEKIMRKKYMPEECQNQGITNEEECEVYMQQKYMPAECLSAGARTREECDAIMFKKYSPIECQEAGIENHQECEDYLFNKYMPKVKCQDIEDWQCKSAVKERHLGNITAKQAQFSELKEKVAQLAGRSVKAEELAAELELAQAIIPVKDKETGLKVLTAEEELTLDTSDNLVQTAPVALMIDSDQDGLSDDMEKRLGTDPNNPDSDGDGYNDSAEVKSSNNPLGPGKLTSAIAPIDQAILRSKTLGQPKTEGEISEDLAVENVVNNTDEQNGANKGYSLSGKAEANSVATLYIYSDLPLVATVKADEYGNWQYEFDQSLIEGEHEVYVAVNDNTGKVLTKSNPLNFFVKEARAVSVKDFVATSVTTTKKSESMIKYYIITSVLLIIAGISLFIMFIRQKKKHSLMS